MLVGSEHQFCVQTERYRHTYIYIYIYGCVNGPYQKMVASCLGNCRTSSTFKAISYGKHSLCMDQSLTSPVIYAILRRPRAPAVSTICHMNTWYGPPIFDAMGTCNMFQTIRVTGRFSVIMAAYSPDSHPAIAGATRSWWTCYWATGK